MGIIATRQVSVVYDSNYAVKDVDIEIRKEEIFSIIGPNGAGKTTLLRVLAGLQQPTTGNLLFYGNIVTKERLPQLRLNVTMVFQKPILFGTTVFKNVAYGLRMRRLPEKEIVRRVKDALNAVEILELKNRAARELSGGEQKRVALAMGIALDPEVLLLDEPMAYLDGKGINVVRLLLKKLRNEKNLTIVIATHDIFQAAELSDRTALLQRGQLKRVDFSRDLLRDELETIVFSDMTCNLFKGWATDIEREKTGPRLVRIHLDDGPEIDAVAHRSGDVMVRIPPEDIVISKEPVLSSARNSLTGCLVAIERENATTKVVVDVGVELTAIITSSSLERLGISIGDRVYVTFKASAIRVY